MFHTVDIKLPQFLFGISFSPSEWPCYLQIPLMPQSHPTTGPVLSPVRFLAHKAEWSDRRNFMSVLFSWSHQATGPARLDMAVYLWLGWIIRRTPRVPRAGIVRAPHRNLQCFSYPTGPVRDPQGCRTAPLRTRKGIGTTRIGKNPARASYLAVRGRHRPLAAPARAVHRLFKIPKPVRGP